VITTEGLEMIENRIDTKKSLIDTQETIGELDTQEIQHPNRTRNRIQTPESNSAEFIRPTGSHDQEADQGRHREIEKTKDHSLQIKEGQQEVEGNSKKNIRTTMTNSERIKTIHIYSIHIYRYTFIDDPIKK